LLGRNGHRLAINELPQKLNFLITKLELHRLPSSAPRASRKPT
jgi:nitrogen fixation protein